MVIHDPKVGKNDVFDALVGVKKILSILIKKLIYEINIPKATENADAVLIMTEWEDYKNLDWKKLQIKMRKPSWVFDTRSIISPDRTKKKQI